MGLCLLCAAADAVAIDNVAQSFPGGKAPASLVASLHQKLADAKAELTVELQAKEQARTEKKEPDTGAAEPKARKKRTCRKFKRREAFLAQARASQREETAKMPRVRSSGAKASAKKVDLGAGARRAAAARARKRAAAKQHRRHASDAAARAAAGATTAADGKADAVGAVQAAAQAARAADEAIATANGAGDAEVAAQAALAREAAETASRAAVEATALAAAQAEEDAAAQADAEAEAQAQAQAQGEAAARAAQKQKVKKKAEGLKHTLAAMDKTIASAFGPPCETNVTLSNDSAVTKGKLNAAAADAAEARERSGRKAEADRLAQEASQADAKETAADAAKSANETAERAASEERKRAMAGEKGRAPNLRREFVARKTLRDRGKSSQDSASRAFAAQENATRREEARVKAEERALRALLRDEEEKLQIDQDQALQEKGVERINEISERTHDDAREVQDTADFALKVAEEALGRKRFATEEKADK